MSKSFRDLRRPVALLASVLMLASCAPRTLSVPRENYQAASRESGEYRIETVNGETYLANRFSVNDATLAIGRLSLSDKAHAKTPLPVVIPLADVVSIHRVNPETPTWVWILGAAAFIGVVALLSSGDAFTDR